MIPALSAKFLRGPESVMAGAFQQVERINSTNQDSLDTELQDQKHWFQTAVSGKTCSGSTSLSWQPNSENHANDDQSQFSSLGSINSSLEQESEKEKLPKFSETFWKTTSVVNLSKTSSSSDCLWESNSNTSSRASSTDALLFEDGRKRFNWDKAVDKVFEEEIKEWSKQH